jgi:glycosyltransferase involved in cell wall biosynthesis
MSARVGVIIPTYNRAAYLARAIQSALDQWVPDGKVEVIVVDDGSTDETASVVARFAPRVHYVRQGNRREGAARNNGAGRASGEYVAFLDSDDYFLPDKLATDIARLQQGDRPALVYSRALNIDPLDRVLGSRWLAAPQGDTFWALARENFVPLSTVTVRADAFRSCGGFVEDPALSGTADWELWMRMAARWPIGFSEQTATCIRVHPRSMMRDPTWMERSMLAGVRHALRDPIVARRVGRRKGQVWSHMYVTIALNAYANGRRLRGWYWLARAVQVWPPQALSTRFLGALVRALLGRRGVYALRTAIPAARQGAQGGS